MKITNYFIGLIIFVSLTLGMVSIASRNFEISHISGTQISADTVAAQAALDEIQANLDAMSTQVKNMQTQTQNNLLVFLVFQAMPGLLAVMTQFIWFGITLPGLLVTFISISLKLPIWFTSMLLYSAIVIIVIKLIMWLRGGGEI